MGLSFNNNLNQSKTITFKNNDEALMRLASASDRDLQKLATYEALEKRLEDPGIKLSQKSTKWYPAADVLLTASTTSGGLTDKLTSGAARAVFWYFYNAFGKGVSKILGKFEEKPKVQKLKQDHPVAYEAAKVGGLVGVFYAGLYGIEKAMSKVPELLNKLGTNISPEGTESIKAGFSQFAERINNTSGAQGTSKVLDKIGKAAPFVYLAALVGFGALIIHHVIENVKMHKRVKQNFQNLQFLRQEAKNKLTSKDV